ncbi:MAG: DUF4174 domain-containing protein [Acidobacteriaceae bacterium]|nr:DUF4174 domain-containing protein [Acidobacteriaceae bacterium]
MRVLIFVLAFSLTLPALAQTATAPVVTDANGRKLVPARHCLVYEDDPEAANYKPAPAAPKTPTKVAASHPIVLAKPHSASTYAPAKTAAVTAARSAKPLPAAKSSSAKSISTKPVLTASVSVPPRPVAEANVAPAPYSENPIQQLRGNARVLLIFAPSAETPVMQEEMLMVERHQLEFTQRNTVVVPILNPNDSRNFEFNGEHLDSGTAADLASARQKFGIKPDQFAIVLLDDQGIERTRWTQPVSASDLDDQIDAIDDDSVIVHNLNVK